MLSGAHTLRAAVSATAALAFSLTFAMPAAAQTGSLDPTFGTGGSTTVALGSSAGAASVAVQSNGDIVTAGQATVGGHNVIMSTRMNPNGTLDQTYGNHGVVTVNINGGAGVDSGDALAIQSDGKIVIVGSGEQTIYGPLEFAAVRLNSNGSLDQTFGTGGYSIVPIGPYSIANGVAIQPNGDIVMAGSALIGHVEFAAARLLPNGALDTSFGSNGTVTLSPTGGAWGMALQSNGDIVLNGQANYANPYVSNAQQFMTARLTPSGQLDPTFGQGGIVMTPVGATSLGFGVQVQPTTGKLVLAGIGYTNTGVNAVVRLNSNGSLDTTFGSGGIGTVPDWYGANGIVMNSAGYIVLPAVGPSAVTFNPGGTADQLFGTSGIAMANTGTGGGANGAAIQPDGKIVLAGATTVGGQTVLQVERLSGPTSTTTSTTTKTARTAAARSGQRSGMHRRRVIHQRKHHTRHRHRHA